MNSHEVASERCPVDRLDGCSFLPEEERNQRSLAEIETHGSCCTGLVYHAISAQGNRTVNAEIANPD